MAEYTETADVEWVAAEDARTWAVLGPLVQCPACHGAMMQGSDETPCPCDLCAGTGRVARSCADEYLRLLHEYETLTADYDRMMTWYGASQKRIAELRGERDRYKSQLGGWL